MNDRLSDEQNTDILNALNDAIENGPWDDSNFLKVIGKNLRGIRDNYLTQLGASSQAQIKADAQLASSIALRSGQQEVYVSLYSSEGTNLQSWERIISNLPRQMISRPIYANEEDVKASLKIKENKVNDAYVAIYINQNDVLPLASDKISLDKLGKPLLCLKDKTLHIENITRVVHVSGVYQFAQGRLIKIS